jgi:hypothetical protein
VYYSDGLLGEGHEVLIFGNRRCRSWPLRAIDFATYGTYRLCVYVRAGMPIFVHDFGAYVPTSECEWNISRNVYDKALIRRIANAFIYSSSKATDANVDQWTFRVATHQQLVHFLQSSQYEMAHELLRNMFATPLSHGFQQGEIVAQALKTSAHSRDHVLTNYIDKLLALASFLRIVPIQNPEQGAFAPYLEADPDCLLDAIEQKVKVAIKAPPFQGGLWGLKTGRGLFSDRDFIAVFVALRIRDLAEGHPAKICEIGGGAGYLAYYCRLLGLTDFTIIDLPTVGAVQAYFLAQNLGPDKVFLAGEVAAKNGVKILAPEDFHMSSSRWDIVVNVDSFPEMATPIMERYLRRIGANGATLLSINQETLIQRTATPGDRQERVCDVIDRSGIFRRISRAPFWMRRGYVEELFVGSATRDRLPADFDSAAYLQANPDVAAAGANAAEHYLAFGMRERRPLK